MSKRIRYWKYKILELTSSGLDKKVWREKRKKVRQEIQFDKMGALGKALQKLDNYQAYQKNYLLFKQRYHVEIPADICGLGNHFELVKIKLKDLRRKWINNKIIPLTECAQYKYLKTKESKIYLDYLKIHQQIQFITTDSLTYSLDRFKKLLAKIKKEGYNPKKSIIVIDKDNCICDGVHRSCILLYLKGPETEIPVIRVSQETLLF